jgi:glycerol-3-phosphate dehydrogenase
MGVIPAVAGATWGESAVKITIIGAGNVGAAIGRAAIATGNEVTLTAGDAA